MSAIEKYATKNNLRIVDAKAPLSLEVTSTNIRKARRKDPSKCAFANAACGNVKGVKAAHFFRTTAWLEFKDKLVRYALPSSMQKEVVAFDRSRSMEPGAYRLSVPQKVRPATKSGKKNPKSKRGRIRHRTQNVRASTLV